MNIAYSYKRECANEATRDPSHNDFKVKSIGKSTAFNTSIGSHHTSSYEALKLLLQCTFVYANCSFFLIYFFTCVITHDCFTLS